MAGIEIVPATTAHAERLAATFSLESWNGMYGRDPLTVVKESIAHSRFAEAVSEEGELLFIWGVREIPPGDIGLGWFMTSEAVSRHKLTFWRESQRGVRLLTERYPIVTNLIDHRNQQTIRWAMRMGFTVYPVEHQDGRSFHRAELLRRASHV